jgi:DNA-binding transcriptional regulator YhcF (GntR family)
MMNSNFLPQAGVVQQAQQQMPQFQPMLMQDPTDPADKRLVVEFYYDAKQKGDGDFIQVPFIKVSSPEGDVHVEEIKGDVQDANSRANYWFKRFPRRYLAAFQEGEKPPEGTPLQMLAIPIAQKAKLEWHKVTTVEQLAAVTDSDLNAFGPGFRELRQKARAYVEALEGTAPVLQLNQELEKTKARNAQLEKTVEKLVDRVDKLLAQQADLPPVVEAEAEQLEDEVPVEVPATTTRSSSKKSNKNK